MIRHEAAIFLVVGSITVLVDFAAYTLLQGWLTVPVDIAKGVGFLVGTAFAYFANRHWTFGHQNADQGGAWRFALLYGVTLAFNVMVNAVCLHVFLGLAWNRQVAFLMATGVSACLNFLGMKYFVFRQRPVSGLTSP